MTASGTLILASLALLLSLAFLSVAVWLWIRQRRIARDLERKQRELEEDDAAWLLREALRLAESIPRLKEKK